jgi:hypothetical protein
MPPLISDRALAALLAQRLEVGFDPRHVRIDLERLFERRNRRILSID